MTEPVAQVHAAISQVQAAIAKIGIPKDRINAVQGYSFRSIEDVYAVLAPLLPEHGLRVYPRVLERQCDVRATKGGSALYAVTVHAAFDFVSVADGSMITVMTYGEASDSGDKATNKAMSAAFKYAATMTFCIPTEGSNDADEVDPPPSVATITGAQFKDLQDLAMRAGVSMKQFCAKANIDSVTVLPAVHFDKAKAWLEGIAAKRAASPSDDLGDLGNVELG